MRIHSSFLWISVVFLLVSCGGGSGTTTPSNAQNPGAGAGQITITGAVITAEIPKTDVLVQLLDAKDGSLVTASITARILGHAVNNTKGKRSAVLSSDQGLLYFSLDDVTVPTPAAPVALRLIVDDPAYVATSLALELTKTGRQSLSLRLVQRSAPPADVVIGQKTFPGALDASGATTQALALNAPANAAGIVSGVVIPAGVVIRDKNQQPLQGDLSVSVAHYDNASQDALAAFPGGFLAQVSRTDGSQSRGNFISGGFLAVEVSDQNGNKGTSFSQNLALSTRIPTGVINPDTGQALKTGDSIPLWSYDPDTGLWAEEGKASITLAAGSQDAEVLFNVNHLTYFNMDWHYSPVCSTASIDLREINGTSLVGKSLRIDSRIIGYRSRSVTVSDGLLRIYGLPKSYPLRFTASYQGHTVGQLDVSLSNSCQARMNIDIGKVPTPVDYTVRIKPASCNGVTLNPPRSFLYYRTTQGTSFVPWTSVTSVEDQGDQLTHLTLRADTGYEAWVYLAGSYRILNKVIPINRWIQADFTSPSVGKLGKEKVVSMDSLCQKL